MADNRDVRSPDSDEEREFDIFADVGTIVPYQYEPLASEEEDEDVETQEMSIPIVANPRIGHSNW